MDHAYYASPWASIAWPLIFGPLLAIWLIGRKNLLGKTIYRNLPGTFLFWLGTAILATLALAGAGRVVGTFLAPTPAIAVSAAGVTCGFSNGPIVLPWQFVIGVDRRTNDVPRRGVTVHEHYATFRLDPRFIDHLPWDAGTRRSRTAACYLDDLDAAPDTIYRAIDASWQAAPH